MKNPRHAAAALLLVVVTLVPLAGGAAPRLTPLAAVERDAAARAVIERFASLGMGNAVATYARYPALAMAMLPYTEYVLTKSALPARHRELLWLRTAWLARSDYVWAQRAPAARREGLTDEDLLRIARGPDSAGWEPFEAALLRAADELRVDAFVSDATWTALAARYDESQLIDLAFGVGELTMHADFANTLGIEPEPELTDHLPAGVAYAPAARQTNSRLIGRRPRIEPLAASGSGPAGNVFRTFARNPPADELRNAQGAHIRGANMLAPRNRQLVIMRVGVLARSEYEWAAHSRGGRQVGMNDADVVRVAAGPTAPGGTLLETLLLRAVDELYRDNVIDGTTWEALARELSVQQLLDVLFTVGSYRSVSYALNSAGVQLDSNMADFRFPPELR